MACGSGGYVDGADGTSKRGYGLVSLGGSLVSDAAPCTSGADYCAVWYGAVYYGIGVGGYTAVYPNWGYE